MGRPVIGSPGRGAAAAAARSPPVGRAAAAAAGSLPVGRTAAAKVRRVQQTQKVENDDH